MGEDELMKQIEKQSQDVHEEEAECQRKHKDKIIGTFTRSDDSLSFGFVVCSESAPVPTKVSIRGTKEIFCGAKCLLETGVVDGDVIAFRVEQDAGRWRVAMDLK